MCLLKNIPGVLKYPTKPLKSSLKMADTFIFKNGRVIQQLKQKMGQMIIL